MHITILYDNESLIDGLRSDWGFACLVTHNNVNLLFDTGGNGALLLDNMRALGIDPASIHEVFISHSHFDHSGGLSTFLNENSDVQVYAPAALRGIRSAREAVYVEEPMDLGDGFYTTGMLGGIEQSLAVRTVKGIAVVVGCSHPGAEAILTAAQAFGTPYALVGGLHGFDAFDVLQPLELICPTHCTQHIAEIKSRYPDKYIQGGAGASYEL